MQGGIFTKKYKFKDIQDNVKSLFFINHIFDRRSNDFC